MKIGIILDSEFLIDIRVSNEAYYLASLGYDIHVLCPRYENQQEFEVNAGVTIHRFKLKRSLRNKLYGFNNVLPLYELYWIKRVKKFVRSIRPDVLHAHDLYMSRIAYKGGEKNLPVVLDLHENYPAAFKTYKWVTKFPYNLVSRPNAWEKKEQRYLSFADRIVVLSDHFKKQLLKKYSRLKSDSIFVYPNVPDVNTLLSYPIAMEVYPKQNKFILFYFGGISERRGIFTCFEAIKLLSEKIPNVHLLLIGPVDGHEKAVFNHYITDPQIRERVTHFSWKDISEFPSYVSISDVCLSPIFKNEQHESGVANKIFQYMLFAKPLIVSDCIPQVDIVESENCGLVHRSGDAIDLANQIQKLWENRPLSNQMGINGKQAVLKKYNLKDCGEQLRLLYESII